MGARSEARRILSAAVPVAMALLWLSAGEALALGGQPVPVRGANPVARSPIRSGEDARLQVERLEQRWESVLRVREGLGPHAMSQKGLARRDARVRGLFRRGTPEPDTLRVLIIRIAFDGDSSGALTSITEDGNFQLEPDPSILFDPPPHDRRYFEAHATALAEYWSSMSNGQIVAKTTVLPPGNEDAYLVGDTAEYGPGSGNFWTVELLERLVQDMIVAADEGTLFDGSANLADYDFDDPDTHVIFAHAGADLQSNIVWEPGQPGYSPNDVPTFFVSLGDSAVVDLQSLDSETGEPGRITECSVIPETTSQDGLVGAITAALVHEFGHALGLPDLYSTVTGYPAIGYWGIMGSGTNLAAVVGIPDPDDPDTFVAEVVPGLLPPQPSIWSKWYLGIVDERRLGANEAVSNLPASYRQDTREKVLRIDVSADEFFLVENRWIPPVLEPEWNLTADPETGVVLFFGEYRQIGPEEFELLGNTHLYDFFMPWPGGVLIWRVRQDRVEAGMPTNTVQVSPTRLGVELVEADGIKDIGVPEFTTRGFVGSDSDAFRLASTFVYDEGSLDIPGTATEFGPDTFPASRSSFRIPTGVTVSGIGPTTDDATSVTTRIDGFMKGPGGSYPVEVVGPVDAEGYGRVTAGDGASLGAVDVAGRTAVLVAAALGAADGGPGLYAYDREGRPFLAEARVADLPGRAVGGLALTQDGDVVVATDAGTVNVFAPSSGFAAGVALDFGPVDTQPLVVGSMPTARAIAASRATSRVFSVALDPDSTAVEFDLGEGARLQADPVIARSGGEDAIAILRDGTIELWHPDGQTTGVAWALPDAAAPDSVGWLVTWPATEPGDDDRIISVNERGQIASVLPGETPELVGPALGEAPVDELVLADVDGDGRLDLVVTTSERVHALNEAGAPLRGFPVPLSSLLIVLEREEDRLVRSPVVADLDGDGLNELALTSRYGITHLLSHRGESEEGFPRAFSSGGSVLGVVDFADGGTRALVSFDALGDSLGSGRRIRASRLNALDRGPAPDEAPEARPAEWTVRGGSMARDGRGRPGAASTGAPDLAEGLDTAMVIPNPVSGTDDRAFVRYYSGGAHTATITLYTLEGEEVGRWAHDVGATRGPVQLEWSPGGLVSGPYLCRVDYMGRDGRSTDLKTVYVER